MPAGLPGQIVCLRLAGDGVGPGDSFGLQSGQKHSLCSPTSDKFLWHPPVSFPEVTHPSMPKYSVEEELCHSVTQRTITSQSQSPIPSQTPRVPASTSTFLQSSYELRSLHTCPISAVPKSFEGNLEVKQQTNFYLILGESLGSHGSSSTVSLHKPSVVTSEYAIPT